MDLTNIDLTDNIRQSLQTYGFTLSTIAGSPYDDLITQPLGFFLKDMYSELVDFYAKTSAPQVPYLDSLAAQHLLTRSNTNPKFASVILYYSNPVDVLVPQGAIIAFGDNQFVSLNKYNIYSQDMANSFDETQQLYATNVLDFAATSDIVTAITAGNLGSTADIYPIPVSIQLAIDVPAGEVEESDNSLYARILEAEFNPTYVNNYGINVLLATASPTITSTIIKGYGSPELLRSLVASGVNVNAYITKSDFLYVASGVHTTPYNPNTAFASVLITNPLASGVNLINPSEVNTEFTNDMYSQIAVYDASYTSLNTPVIYQNNLTDESTLTLWEKKDAYWKDNKGMIRPDEITITSSGVKLGVIQSEFAAAVMAMTKNDVNFIKKLILLARTVTVSGRVTLQDLE
jgi:hypothetical protein